MIAHYVEWQMRKVLASLLLDDGDSDGATRPSLVQPANRSGTERAKARGAAFRIAYPIRSFRTLLGDLSTPTRNRIQHSVRCLESRSS